MYGIIGNPLDHSWSPDYFNQKFDDLNLREVYGRFALNDIKDFPGLLQQFPDIKGLNVTTPYKEQVIPYLDRLSPDAAAVQSVNCIQIISGKTVGHNTDIIGFEQSLAHFLPEHFPSKALILGTGGASKAVATVLKGSRMPFRFVSRKGGAEGLLYEDINAALLQEHLLIINTTPLGMWPHVDECPDIPYHLLSNNHFLFDLIYNPEETRFLKQGKEQGASVQNGLEMLVIQAEASWQIWQTG